MSVYPSPEDKKSMDDTLAMLTLEDQFRVRQFDMGVDTLSEAEAKVLLKSVHLQMVAKDRIWRQVAKGQTAKEADSFGI